MKINGPWRKRRPETTQPEVWFLGNAYTCAYRSTVPRQRLQVCLLVRRPVQVADKPVAVAVSRRPPGPARSQPVNQAALEGAPLGGHPTTPPSARCNGQIKTQARTCQRARCNARHTTAPLSCQGTRCPPPGEELCSLAHRVPLT